MIKINWTEQFITQQVKCLDMLTELIEFDKQHGDPPEKARVLEGFIDTQRRALDMAAKLLEKHKPALEEAEKAEREKQEAQEKIEAAKQKVEAIKAQIEELKSCRRRRSEALQRWIFTQFSMLNACGQRRNLLEIFADTPQRVPPAGAGECAAPRLLQFAFMHGLKPMAIAEFWFGRSQSGLVRHDGQFYTACRGKCLPILSFMLQGIDMEIDPPHTAIGGCDVAHVIYEDQWIIAVDKPAGMPTVPGRNCGQSLLEWLNKSYPQLSGPVVVHRLDMDTSGVVIFARDKDTHKQLQAMFARHEVHKRYIAILDGLISTEQGIIDLPLCPDYEHRPMQMVDYKNGYQAITRYEVVKRYPQQCKTMVYFYPLTGRTHQLRLHAAHHAGLDTPIVGDRLYGNHSDGARLCLHAEMIAFNHPCSGRYIELHAPLPPDFGRT